MRDLERVKDKIEIRLEPRQVVTLGVATAVFSGVLFAAGYWVGHRQRVEPTAGSGDLARLDAARRPNRPGPGSSAPVAALGDVEFLFPSVVAAGPSRGGPEQVPVRVPAIVMQPSNTENVVAPAEPAAREEGTPGPKAGTAATPGLPPAPSPPDEDEGRVDGPVSPVTPPRVEVAPIPPPPDAMRRCLLPVAIERFGPCLSISSRILITLNSSRDSSRSRAEHPQLLLLID